MSQINALVVIQKRPNLSVSGALFERILVSGNFSCRAFFTSECFEKVSLLQFHR